MHQLMKLLGFLRVILADVWCSLEIKEGDEVI